MGYIKQRNQILRRSICPSTDDAHFIEHMYLASIRRPRYLRLRHAERGVLYAIMTLFDTAGERRNTPATRCFDRSRCINVFAVASTILSSRDNAYAYRISMMPRRGRMAWPPRCVNIDDASEKAERLRESRRGKPPSSKQLY